MQLGSYLWKGFNEALDYGFLKLDQGSECLSKAAFVATNRILQTDPAIDPFAHSFSPQFYSAMLWIKENPKAINKAVNIGMMASGLVQGKIDLIHLFQLFIDEETKPMGTKILIFLNALNIYQIGVNQLLGMTTSTLIPSLIETCVNIGNIHYNNVMIKKYNDNAKSKAENLDGHSNEGKLKDANEDCFPCPIIEGRKTQ